MHPVDLCILSDCASCRFVHSSRHFHLGDKEVFDSEVFAIYQALSIFEAKQRSGRKFTIFSDSQLAIRRTMTGLAAPGEQWARAIIEVASRLMASVNEVRIMWVPAHKGVGGNEVADHLRSLGIAAMGKIVLLGIFRHLRHLRHLRYLRNLRHLRHRHLKLGQMVTISQRPSGEVVGVGSRRKWRRKGTRGPYYGHIYRKAQQPSSSIRGRYTAG